MLVFNNRIVCCLVLISMIETPEIWMCAGERNFATASPAESMLVVSPCALMAYQLASNDKAYGTPFADNITYLTHQIACWFRCRSI